MASPPTGPMPPSGTGQASPRPPPTLPQPSQQQAPTQPQQPPQGLLQPQGPAGALASTLPRARPPMPPPPPPGFQPYGSTPPPGSQGPSGSQAPSHPGTWQAPAGVTSAANRHQGDGSSTAASSTGMVLAGSALFPPVTCEDVAAMFSREEYLFGRGGGMDPATAVGHPLWRSFIMPQEEGDGWGHDPWGIWDAQGVVGPRASVGAKGGGRQGGSGGGAGQGDAGGAREGGRGGGGIKEGLRAQQSATSEDRMLGTLPRADASSVGGGGNADASKSLPPSFMDQQMHSFNAPPPPWEDFRISMEEFPLKSMKTPICSPCPGRRDTVKPMAPCKNYPPPFAF
eukprot:jgi/Mesvir1/21867/Mv04244-RA.1